MFTRLAKICKEAAGVDIAQTLGIKVAKSLQSKVPVVREGAEDLGCVKWMGPGTLIVPAGSDRRAVCQVELKKPLDKEVLMVDVSHTAPLPAGTLLHPMLLPSSEVDVNHFPVLVRNESARDTVLAVETVMGNICLADSVMPALPHETKSTTKETPRKLDPRLIDFGDSPVPEQWKSRLRKKLSERASVFSLHEWDVGLCILINSCIS